MRNNLLKHLTSLLTLQPPRASLPVFAALLGLYSLPSQAIVGGFLVPSSTVIEKHTVAVFDSSNSSTCTGTLIAPDVVVTAAHCLIHPKEGITVIFGTDSVANIKNPNLTRKAVSTKISPEFSTTQYGDIGLIKLSAPAPEGYAPVPYATSATTPDGVGMSTYPNPATAAKEHVSFTTDRPLILAGYGFFKYDTIKVNRNDERLAQAIAEGRGGCNDYKTVCHITVIGHDKKLRATYVTLSKMNSSILTLDETHGRGTCYGDSGGPAFVVDEKNQLILVGVNSGGDVTDDNSGECGASTSIKTLVSHHAPWIDSMIMSGF